jgi:transposase
MPKLHRNARTCPHCRSLIVRRLIDGGQKPTPVARDFLVSERTVSKWLKRFRAQGARGLDDRTSRPNHIPRRYLQPGEELRDAVFSRARVQSNELDASGSRKCTSRAG